MVSCYWRLWKTARSSSLIKSNSNLSADLVEHTNNSPSSFSLLHCDLPLSLSLVWSYTIFVKTHLVVLSTTFFINKIFTFSLQFSRQIYDVLNIHSFISSRDGSAFLQNSLHKYTIRVSSDQIKKCIFSQQAYWNMLLEFVLVCRDCMKNLTTRTVHVIWAG